MPFSQLVTLSALSSATITGVLTSFGRQLAAKCIVTMLAVTVVDDYTRLVRLLQPADMLVWFSPLPLCVCVCVCVRARARALSLLELLLPFVNRTCPSRTQGKAFIN